MRARCGCKMLSIRLHRGTDMGFGNKFEQEQQKPVEVKRSIFVGIFHLHLYNPAMDSDYESPV